MSGQPPEPSSGQNGGHENAPEASTPATSSSRNALTLGNRIDLTVKESKLFIVEGIYTYILPQWEGAALSIVELGPRKQMLTQ